MQIGYCHLIHLLEGNDMTIATEFGNFGSFKDLNTFMRLEGKSTVFVSSADYWGINCIISRQGTVLTKKDIENILEE